MSSTKEPWVLGISASHNGAVCLLKGDKIVVAIQEERVLGAKRARLTLTHPSLAFNYCLQYAGIKPEDLDCIAISSQFPLNHPTNDFKNNKQLISALDNAELITVGHHNAHAHSAFATSGYKDSAILVIDGMGGPYQDLTDDEKSAVINNDNGCEIISLYNAEGTTINAIEKHMVSNGKWLAAPDPSSSSSMGVFGSLGAIFSIASQQIFGTIYEAGKVMGLAPYGKATIPIDNFYTIENGQFIFNNKVAKRFNSLKRWPEHEEDYQNLACSAQVAVEEAILYLAKKLRKNSTSKNLVYAGGVALNSVANERIVREAGFENVFFFPPAEDSGPAVGAAYYGLWKMGYKNNYQKMVKDSFGVTYTQTEINTAIDHAPWAEVVKKDANANDIADLLMHNNIIGWYSGGSELGPRSLGQRSILCDPRRSDAKDVLNARIKHREGFRPFAPVILAEEVENWFELDGYDSTTPYMLRVLRFKEEAINKVPGVVHYDGTGRVQTVTEKHNGPYYDVVKAFFDKTGVPILINTSLNVMGEPIVETPEDALWSLAMTDLDYCIFENTILRKQSSLTSVLDFYPSLILPSNYWAAANRMIKESGYFPVTTPWGKSHFLLEDPLTKMLALQGLAGEMNGKTSARSMLNKLMNHNKNITESAMVRSLVQLRRGRMIKLSTTPIC